MLSAAKHVVKITGTLACLLVLASCANSFLYTELTATGYTVERYSDYAPVVVYNVTNPSTNMLTGAVLTASCKEDQYPNLDHKFESRPFAIAPGQVIEAIPLLHVGGFPYFTQFRVSCHFDGHNQRFPLEAEITIEFK